MSYSHKHLTPLFGVATTPLFLQCIALVLGHCEFHCSSSWLEHFKARNNIAFRRMCGESSSVTPEMTSDWLSQTLPSLLAEYKPEDIFNADETGLFWKCLPDKTMRFKGDRCNGGKRSKERITVMVCASMIGEKVPLLVIGKFKNPRCFKNVRSLPITYKANTRAWMISELFTSWIIDFDKKFQRQNRNVALIIDNCLAHPDVQSQLKAIRLVFLPPNTTYVLQPCDQGIIKNLKTQYRKYLLLKLIAAVEANEEFTVTLLDCMYLLRLVWENISAKTIANSFLHCGFQAPEESLPCPQETEEDSSTLGEALLSRFLG